MKVVTVLDTQIDLISAQQWKNGRYAVQTCNKLPLSSTYNTTSNPMPTSTSLSLLTALTIWHRTFRPLIPIRYKYTALATPYQVRCILQYTKSKHRKDRTKKRKTYSDHKEHKRYTEKSATPQSSTSIYHHQSASLRTRFHGK